MLYVVCVPVHCGKAIVKHDMKVHMFANTYNRILAIPGLLIGHWRYSYPYRLIKITSILLPMNADVDMRDTKNTCTLLCSVL